MTPRIPPGRLRELGPVNWAFCRIASRVVGVPDMHIFSTLGRTGGLFRGWLHHSARLMPFGPLSRLDTEMVIIRVAALRECGYELDHHLRLGRRAGIDADLAARIQKGPDALESERSRVLLTAVDELVADRDISDPTWEALSRHLTERERIGLLLLVGNYDSLATTISTLRIERDR
ncbi:carboxymuconolactone decarboxylase family protein [Williamsia serinedens]|uniref:Alkylhydroperoxidase AhpD family core domain-containing protein n=1 Tax=Williamsia serinedens TaxID=391736 RepID=A0ABT1H521_9NOCA|nr:carboxymuconolactone decarboxylase family protein [Williamsia serinedens]MCP2162054.1 alkylhydroperoxidase AhpD family core domain-containing protein [Williamsia serinedens]